MYIYDSTNKEWDKVGGGPSIPTNPVAYTNAPANPSLMLWQEFDEPYDQTIVPMYAQPGALVTVGRTNYNDQYVKDLAAGGATVLLYLDPIIDATWGRYHDLLINASTLGPKVNRWPGEPQANEWGYLNDFRPGQPIHAKWRAVLELVAEELPHISGIMIDDLGTRSWYPGFNWNTWSAQYKSDYRNGAIEFAQTARDVADEVDWFLIANGVWTANDGGGYPDATKNGCSLIDGGVWENHSASDLSTFTSVYGHGANNQWGKDTPRGLPYIWTWNIGERSMRDTHVATGIPSFAMGQDDRHIAETPWTTFTDFGLPRRTNV